MADPIERIKEVARRIAGTHQEESREILMALRDIEKPSRRRDDMSRKFRRAIRSNPDLPIYGPNGIQGLIGCKKGFVERELRRMKQEGLATPGYYAGEKQGLYAGGRKS